MDIQEFATDYYRRFVHVLECFDKSELTPIYELMETVAAHHATLWVAGNGGSAAISDHTVCDCTKLTYVEGQPQLRSVSLASNGSMMTALANDLSYEDVFSQQLEYYLKPGDAVLLVSSSGNSLNVIKACEYANSRDIPTIAFVGFSGGRLKEIAKYSIWVPVENYGIVEDTHQSLMHVLSQFLRYSNEKKSNV